MHGHTKKDEEKKTDEDRAVMAKKAAKYGAMSSMLLGRRAAGQGDDESFEMTGKALRMNPDFYSLWNFRRDMLISRHGPTLGLANYRVPSDGGEGGVEVETGGRKSGAKASPLCKISTSFGAEVVASEFRLTTDAILKNPKCYGAWHHRQWIAERFHYDTAAELNLCRDFLKADQRNVCVPNPNVYVWAMPAFSRRSSYVAVACGLGRPPPTRSEPTHNMF
jgi:geranylgeranyl transferase type-2 subunit alpha